MFDITIQRNNSEANRLHKTVTTLASLQGYLREGTSIIDPVILVEASIETLAGCNYLAVPKFKRKYFINNVVSVSTSLVEIHCHVDVLSSFETEIKANKAILSKAEDSNAYSLYLNDNSLHCFQNPKIQTKEFPSGFSSSVEFVLAVAGG